MFKFIKSMSWFIKKNWYRYILVVFFGLLLTLLNLLPAKIIANLTNGIENNNLTNDYLIYNVDEVEEYDEIEEKENIISRFDEIVLFVNKDDEIYAITVAPKGINSPNVTIY